MSSRLSTPTPTARRRAPNQGRTYNRTVESAEAFTWAPAPVLGQVGRHARHPRVPESADSVYSRDGGGRWDRCRRSAGALRRARCSQPHRRLAAPCCDRPRCTRHLDAGSRNRRDRRSSASQRRSPPDGRIDQLEVSARALRRDRIGTSPPLLGTVGDTHRST
jgi:hypothetical protein